MKPGESLIAGIRPDPHTLSPSEKGKGEGWYWEIPSSRSWGHPSVHAQRPFRAGSHTVTAAGAGPGVEEEFPLGRNPDQCARVAGGQAQPATGAAAVIEHRQQRDRGGRAHLGCLGLWNEPRPQPHAQLIVPVALELDGAGRAFGRASAATLAAGGVDPGRAAQASDPGDLGTDGRDAEGTGPGTGQTAGALRRIDNGHNAAQLQ